MASGSNKPEGQTPGPIFFSCPRSAMEADVTASGPASLGDSRPQSGRPIMVDPAMFEEQFLRCQICHERFNKSERCPKSLPCNHTYCLPCLTQVFEHAQPHPSRRSLLWVDGEMQEGTLKCPTCRVEIVLSKAKIKDLPNDHRVVQMMDFLTQAVSANTQNVCSKHERQPLNFFCKLCLAPVCRDCTVLDHKEQQGHVIVDVKQAVSESASDFNQVEEISRQILERMKARSDALANASKRLDIQERRLRGEIKETFIEYRLLLEKRQEAMTQTLQQNVRDQKALINARFVNVCEHGTQLQKLFDAFTKAKTANDVQTLFAIHKQMKDQEEQFKAIATAEDDELFRSCSFELTSDCEFLSEISSLGNITVQNDLTLKQPVSVLQLQTLEMEEEHEREQERRLLCELDPGALQDALTTGNEDLDQDLDDYDDTLQRFMDRARYRIHTEDLEQDEGLHAQQLLYTRPRRLRGAYGHTQSPLIPLLGALYNPPETFPQRTVAAPVNLAAGEARGRHSRSGSRSRRSASREQALRAGDFRVVRHGQNATLPDETP